MLDTINTCFNGDEQATCTLFGVTFWTKNCSAHLACEQMPAQLTSDCLPPPPAVACLLLPRDGRDEAVLQERTVPVSVTRLRIEGSGPWPLAPWRPLPLTPAHSHADTDTCTRDIPVFRHVHVQRYTYTQTCAHRHTHARKDTYKQAHVHSAYTQKWTHARVYTDVHVDAHRCTRTAGVTQPPSPLPADILQHYLACSPHAVNPFQQVRAQACPCRAPGALAPTPRCPQTARPPPTSSDPWGPHPGALSTSISGWPA